MNDTNEIPILHIGYGKTGTTWFKRNFYSKISDIDFYDNRRIWKSIGKKWKDIDFSDDMLKLFGENEKRLVICDESMIGSGLQIEQNSKLFKKIFNNAQVIIFIRNQLDKYISNYSQYIRSGGTLEFKEFLFQGGRIFLGEKHKYDSVIEMYKGLYGAKNVYVYLFEDLTKDLPSFLEPFCLNHNFKVDLIHISSKRLNEGLSTIFLKLWRKCNRNTLSAWGGDIQAE